MVRILGFILVSFVALFIFRYLQLQEQFETQPNQAPPPVASTEIPDMLSLPYKLSRPAERLQGLPLTPRNALAQLREEYRLPPDRRFILAFVEMQRFLSPEEHPAFAVHFEDNHWHLTQNGNPVTQFSEFPDFAEAKKYLRQFCKQLLPDTQRFPVGISRQEKKAGMDSRFTHHNKDYRNSIVSG